DWVGEAFFVFQAEDGIRVFHVTGVQTCALPICRARPPSCGGGRRRADEGCDRRVDRRRAERTNALRSSGVAHPGCPGTKPPWRRSEERRVGKECRSRRGPWPGTKKRADTGGGAG